MKFRVLNRERWSSGYGGVAFLVCISPNGPAFPMWWRMWTRIKLQAATTTEVGRHVRATPIPKQSHGATL